MKRIRTKKRQKGFSLIEMMIAAAIFVLLCGAAFALLALAQQRSQTESQVLNSFQEARFALDDMVRDINGSGFPPQNLYSHSSSTLPTPDLYASTPVAWSLSAGYPNSPCQLGGSGNCTGSSGNTPGDFDLIIERDPNPAQTFGVQWIRYQLSNNTLLRGQAAKPSTSPADPDASTSTTFVPYVQNVMNNATPAQIAQFQTVYPQMFPGGNPVPIFSYTCYTPYGPQACSSATASYNSPLNVTDVEITLIVMAPTVDAQTGVPRLIELHGRGHSLSSLQ